MEATPIALNNASQLQTTFMLLFGSWLENKVLGLENNWNTKVNTIKINTLKHIRKSVTQLERDYKLSQASWIDQLGKM